VARPAGTQRDREVLEWDVVEDRAWRIDLLDENAEPRESRVVVEIGLDQLIAVACALSPAARQELRRALEAVGEEGQAWLGGMLTSQQNPVLAELWDNPDDAAYDRL
jgi:hypothetical protein